MSHELKTVLEFVRGAIDSIMIVAGSFLLILAVAFFSRAYQWVSAASLLLGVLLIVVGIVLHYESFTWKVPSVEGWGTILISIAAVFMASSVIVFLFAVPGEITILTTSSKPGAAKVMLVTLTRPTAWLAPILAWIAIGLLVFGVLLKFFRDIF